MKKLFTTIILTTIILSCAKDKCEDKEAELRDKYHQQVINCNNSTPCIKEAQRQLEEKLKEAYKDCY